MQYSLEYHLIVVKNGIFSVSMIGIHIVERSKCQRNRKKKSATVETKLGNADYTDSD